MFEHDLKPSLKADSPSVDCAGKDKAASRIVAAPLLFSMRTRILAMLPQSAFGGSKTCHMPGKRPRKRYRKIATILEEACERMTKVFTWPHSPPHEEGNTPT